jgi:hypothetical protein
MSKATHTPTPYAVANKPYGEPQIVANGPKGQVELATVHGEAEYGILPAQANAEFIAIACNAHVALVTALKLCLTALELADQDRFDDGKVCGKARAALALAQVPAAKEGA